LKEYLHLVFLLFILMNFFQFNLTPSWSCLLMKLAWLLGLLCNWRQSIQLETRAMAMDCLQECVVSYSETPSKTF
jgi:hypothetical protein